MRFLHGSLECREAGSLARAHYRVSRHIGRAQLAGRPANLFVRSCVADCISRPEDIAERQWGKDVALLTKAVRHRQRPGPGGMSEIYYGPKFGRGGGEKMLKILDF